MKTTKVYFASDDYIEIPLSMLRTLRLGNWMYFNEPARQWRFIIVTNEDKLISTLRSVIMDRLYWPQGNEPAKKFASLA